MARCINLKKVLETAKFKGNGRVVIKINDDMIEKNNGTWAIEFKDDALVSLDKTDDAAQAEMSVEIFSALILGRYDMTDADFISGLEVYSESEDLSKIFF